MNFAPAALTKEDTDQLDLLGTLFYVYGALTALVALGIFGFAVIPAILGAGATAAASDAGPPAAFVGGLFFIIFGAVGFVFLVKAVLSFVAGAGLRKRSSYPMIVIGAALALFNMPLGTLLGVFTFIVLQRPAVRALFR
jgi:hypothetical protein